MNKYHIEVLVNNLPDFAKFIKESVENLRSGISKDSLMFTTEFFSNTSTLTEEKYQPAIISFVSITMPSVVFKTVYDKTFIAKEAKTTVAKALEACYYDEMLESLMMYCNGSNKAL